MKLPARISQKGSVRKPRGPKATPPSKRRRAPERPEPAHAPSGGPCATCVAFSAITHGKKKKCRWCRGSESWWR